MGDRLRDLEERLARVEKTILELTTQLALTQGTTVIAPFRVVDREGNILLEVSGKKVNANVTINELRLFNGQGKANAALGVDGGGGYLAIRNSVGQLVGYLTVETSGAKMHLMDNEDKGGVVLSMDDTDGGWINILHRSGDISATLGSDTNGGFLEIYNVTTNEPVVTLSITSTAGRLDIKDTEGKLLLTVP